MPPTKLTELRRNGADLKRLKSDRQRRFALESATGKYGPKEAAVRAGYGEKSAARMASKLLNNPIIKAFIGKAQRLDVEELHLDRQETLRQLYYALTRKVLDFVDERGIPLNPNQLPEHVQSIVDGFTTKVMVNQETGVVLTETTYKLTPHAIAREQAMKHKGLLAPVKVDVRVQADWEPLYGDDGEPVDEVEARLIEEGK